MKIISAQFKCSSTRNSQCPNDGLPEFGFIGRSNVGKSSLINMLTGHGGLAKVSGTPGKTRLINHFVINSSWYLVDLPGYGYARVSKSDRGSFLAIINEYLSQSEGLDYLFILIDSRLEPQKIDIEFISEVNKSAMEFGLVFTKCDKLSENQTASNIAAYKRFMLKAGLSWPEIFITSSEKKRGREELLDFIENRISIAGGEITKE